MTEMFLVTSKVISMSKNEINVETNSGQIIGKADVVNVYEDRNYEKLIPLIKEIARSELEKYTANAKACATQRENDFIFMMFQNMSKFEHSIEELEKAFSTPSMQFDVFCKSLNKYQTVINQM